MRAAARKSSQNRRTKIPRFKQRVTDSRWNDNYKLRVGEVEASEVRGQRAGIRSSISGRRHCYLFPSPVSLWWQPCRLQEETTRPCATIGRAAAIHHPMHVPAPCSLLPAFYENLSSVQGSAVLL